MDPVVLIKKLSSLIGSPTLTCMKTGTELLWVISILEGNLLIGINQVEMSMICFSSMKQLVRRV
jgi:hypothetical protein